MSGHKDTNNLGNPTFWEKKSESFPENTAHSLPVLTKRGTAVFRGEFMYIDKIDEQGNIQRPFAWTLLPLDESPKHMFGWCEVVDFMPKDKYPMGEKISANLPSGKLKGKTEKEYYHEIVALFDEIIGFAFKENLNTYEQEILERYKEIFLKLCYTGLYPFYQSLAGDFFQWIDLELPRESKSVPIVVEKLESLADLFEEKIKDDQHTKEIVDIMHSELQKYKTGAYDTLMLAVERDIIMIIDNISKNLSAIEAEGNKDYPQLRSLYLGAKQDLVDVLYRQGIDPYFVEGTVVQVPKQKVLTTVETDNPKLDKTIARRVSTGWQKGKTIVRPEYVEVYLYKENSIQGEAAKEQLDD